MQIVECTSLNINYDNCGKASISMTVYSTEQEVDIDALPTSFGGVVYSIEAYQVSGQKLRGSDIYVFSVTLQGVGK